MTVTVFGGRALKSRFIILLGLIGCLAGTQFAAAESLKNAVRNALTSNPSVLAATSEARANAYDLLKLQSEYQPTVTLYGRAGAQRLDDPSSLSAADTGDTLFAREIGLEAEVVLFDGARRANLVYSNAARVDGSIFRLLDASETLALNATEVYIDTYRHRRLLDAASRNLRRHQVIGRQVNDLVESGRLPVSDRLQIQDRIRAAQLVLIDMRRSVKDAEARYKRIIGNPPSSAMSVPGIRVKVGKLQDLLRVAVENSHRVRIANIEIDRAEYEKKVIEADRKPRVSLNAGIRRGSDLDGNRSSETDTFVGVRMNWILHQGGRNARSRAEIERKHKATSERNVAMREVRELAERTWNGHAANSERLQLLSQQFRINRNLVTQFNSEFEAGTRSLLDVLEAERASFDVEFEKVSAEASLTFSAYRLLATQSRLAQHFGVSHADGVLIPNFEDRAQQSPTSVFKTKIPALDRSDGN
ncbi:MAG: TolC family protein [Paracoccaceae bacterium]